MSVKITVFYSNDEELKKLKEENPILRNVKKSTNTNGVYKKAYLKPVKKI